MKIFCRKIFINNPSWLQEKGPLLLACNHPNSFLDSVLLDVLFRQQVWSLARGDAFINKPVSRLLKAVRILPVYRTSEGVENLQENYKTFDACMRIFKENGIIHIFSEGLCVNEWHLRPLKKGTARLAIKCWEQGLALRVLPVGINYNSFSLFGKNVFIHFGEPITRHHMEWSQPDGNRHLRFNTMLQLRMQPLVFEIDNHDTQRKKELLAVNIPLMEKVIFFLPAVSGWLLHAPLYIPIRKWVQWKFRSSGHYDSVMMALLTLTYPLYLLLVVFLIFMVSQNFWSFSLLFIMPFTAWCYTRIKKQEDE